MKENNKITNYLLNTKEPYILEIDNMRVKMTYSDTDKSFYECMVNILKQKVWSVALYIRLSQEDEDNGKEKQEHQ